MLRCDNRGRATAKLLHQTDMATEESSDTLETWLNKVTDPVNTSERWDCIQGFYQQVITQSDGPQVATRLLAHKIQSPQEREALQALTLLEVCMNNCGKRFQSEAVKFRFLNELIKLLSPKFLGTWSSALVKLRVTEVLYGWTLWLKDEPKVQEAYRMLKKQGIVKQDPKLPDPIIIPPPCRRQEASAFDDEDKAQLLSRLLKSSCPEDLQTANKLIRSTLKEEQERTEKERSRVNILQEVEKCTSQLKFLLCQQHTQYSQEVQDIYDQCDRLRPSLFRLASDTKDNDEDLAEVLQRNDKLTDVMNLYRAKTQKQEAETVLPKNHTSQDPASPNKTYRLIDFSTLGDSAPTGHTKNSNSLLLLEDEVSTQVADSCSSRSLGVKSYLDELTQLQGEQCAGALEDHHGPSLVQEMNLFRSTLGEMLNQPIISEKKAHPASSFMNITLPLDSMKPSHLQPMTVFDHHGVRVTFHFTKADPSSRPDIAVIVISTINTSALSVSDFMFLAAVPKTMHVRLQPATRSDLPAYIPILPPPSISQVLLISNPLKRPVRVRFRLSMMLGEEHVQQEADIDQFPEWDSWINI